MNYLENTKIAIIGVIAIAIISIFELDAAVAEKIALSIGSGLIGYIARGKEV